MVRPLLAAGAAALLASACATEPGSRPAMFGGEHSPPAALASALEVASASPLPALDYRPLAAPGAVSARIDAQSPVVVLPGGRSFVAAYRIDALPRPLAIEVASQRSAEPGSALGVLPDFRFGVFAPVVHVLDARFNPVRTLLPEGPRAECQHNGYADVYRVRFAIDEPADRAAYLVVATTDALRAQEGVLVCGLARRGLSPVGDITLSATPLPMSGRVLLQAEATLFDGVRHASDRSLAQEALQSPGLLLVGEAGIMFVQRSGLGTSTSPYAVRASLPYAMIASVQVDTGAGGGRGRALTLRYLDPVTRAPRWASVDIAAPVVRGDVVAAIEPFVAPGRLREDVAIELPRTTPVIEFIESTGGALARVGEAATAGARATAMPCGLCAALPCGAEAIAACASLASIGAVAGGVIGTGVELVQQVRGQRPPLPDAVGTLAGSGVTEAARPFDTDALGACVNDALAAPGAAAWRVQGREAVARIADATPTADVQGQWRSMVEWSRIVLISAGKPGQEPRLVPVRLRVEGRLTLVDNGQALRAVSLRWESEAWPLEQWMGADAQGRTAIELRAACRALAGQIVNGTRAGWSE